MVQNGGGPVLRLKANKTSLYNLVATYKPLPGMRRVDFQKANGRPDYWLEWTTDDGHTKAFLSSSLGHPILTITTPQLAAINEYLEAEKAVRAAAEILGLDADLMIAEAEGLARATTFSNVEALYFVADQAASGKREVNGHA